MSALSLPLTLTEFPDQRAQTKTERLISLLDLAPVIQRISAPEKSSLPWLKLAAFGAAPTPRGSLRHNANILMVDGIEADYDAGTVSIGHAADLLRAAGVAALLYTSPSHTPEKPRWRALCPLSEPVTPECRREYVGRLNAALGGVLAGESFVLSQAYYYGCVGGNTNHEVLPVEGRPIDQCADLAPVYPTKPGPVRIELPPGGAPDERAASAIARAVELFRDTAGDRHQRILAATYALAPLVLSGHLADGDVIGAITSAMIESGREPNDDEIESALAGALKTARPYREPVSGEFGPAPGYAESIDALRSALCVHTWAALQIPPENRFLGDLVTGSSRAFIVGGTGLGKTQIAHAMAAGIATGAGFLHWRCDRAARCLVIDGEMSAALLKDRTAAVIRRSPLAIPPGNLVIYGLDRSEAFAREFPDLGYIEPLNTQAGQNFVKRLVALVQPDVVFFDNVMSLIAGDQKDEIPWSETLPLVTWITSQGIGQVWLDHTGHDRTRQYGTSTKGWRFDALGIMSTIDGNDQHPGAIGFKLSFEPPYGKARRRTPANWYDFAEHLITLSGDVWSSAPVERGSTAPESVSVKPSRAKWHDALVDAIGPSGTATKDEWFAAGVRKGLTEATSGDDTRSAKEAKRKGFRAAVSDLVAASWVAVDGETVRDIRDCEFPPVVS